MPWLFVFFYGAEPSGFYPCRPCWSRENMEETVCTIIFVFSGIRSTFSEFLHCTSAFFAGTRHTGHCKVMEKCENLRYTILLLSCFFIRSLLFFHHPTLHCAVCRSGKLRIAAPFLAVIRGLALYISVISPLPWLHQTSIRKLHKARHFPL